jgi:hypothetical protein
VTKRTARPQTTFVMTIAMAGFAIQRRAFEQQRAMTLFARHDGVASDQRKSSDIVVKRRFAPADLRMTLLAASA